MSERGGSQGSGTSPVVSVVLLNYRAEDEVDTRACIESLLASDYPALDVVLVDNAAPADVTARLEADFPRVRVLRAGANLGFTGGNNLGIADALERGSAYVFLLNNDTVVEPGCVGHLVRTAESGERVGCVGGKILYHDAPDRIWFGGGELSVARGVGFHLREGEIDDRDSEAPAEVSFLTGCCMLLPADVLRRVGGFEEDFFAYVEDVDLSLRLRRAGFRLLYQPAARLYHRVPLEEPEVSPMKIVLRDRNRRRLARRRYSAAARLRFMLLFYPTRMIHAGRYLLTGDRARLAAIWRGLTER